jgi:hypothetical protein
VSGTNEPSEAGRPQQAREAREEEQPERTGSSNERQPVSRAPVGTPWLAFLRDFPTEANPTGARIDLRLYVAPDGSGQVFPAAGSAAPHRVANTDEAAALLRALWEWAAVVARGEPPDA